MGRFAVLTVLIWTQFVVWQAGSTAAAAAETATLDLVAGLALGIIYGFAQARGRSSIG
jgi:hypothetical protein